MKSTLLEYLVCPECRGGLSLEAAVEAGGEITKGLLWCRSGHLFSIQDSVPRLDPDRAISGSQKGAVREAQVRESFSAKWSQIPTFGFDRPQIRSFYDDWFRRKLGISSREAFEAYFMGKKLVLDAGTGLGTKVETVCHLNPSAQVIGIDISESAHQAHINTRQYGNAHIVQGDLMRPPFREGMFDLIVSDGVLHHTRNTQEAFLALVPLLAEGGEIAIHVYRRMGVIREFCDDFLRAYTSQLSVEECWRFSQVMTRIGRELAEKKIEIEIPEEIPYLGIKEGRYDLQRFFYYHLFKCFWNPDFTFKENTLVNFDWYHPAYARRHTEEEVVGWFSEAGLTEIRVPRANENGVSVVGRRP